MAQNPFSTVIAPQDVNLFQSRSAILGEQIGNAAGAGFSQGFERERERQERIKSAQPFVDAIRKMPQQPNEAPALALLRSLPDANLAEVLSNPDQLRQLLTVGELAKAPVVPPIERIVAVKGDNVLNEQFALGLAPDERARVKLSVDATTGEVLNAGLASVKDTKGGAGGADESPFGNSLKGRAKAALLALASADTEGPLTTEQQRVLASAVNIAGHSNFVDAATGEVVTRPVPLESFAVDLANKYGIGLGAELQSIGGRPGGPAPQLPGGGAAPGTPAPGNEGKPPAFVDLISQLPSGNSIMEQAGNLTGPDSLIARAVGRIPGLGGAVGEAPAAAELANQATELIVGALRVERPESTRAQAEQEQLAKKFGVQPELFSTPELLQQRMAVARRAMEARLRDIDKRLATRPSEISTEQRRNDLDARQRILQALPVISPPIIETQEELDRFAAESAPGTVFMVPNESGAGFRRLRVQ